MIAKDLKNDLLKAIDEVIAPDKKELSEAYVVAPKKFNLNTEKLSPKVKSSKIKHFESTVEYLNKISVEVDSADTESANPACGQFRNAKTAESFLVNDAFLQGQYLDNISDLNSTISMDMLSYIRIARDFGDFDRWQKDFIACAKSSRNGYAVLAYSIHLRRYINVVVDEGCVGALFSAIPVIVIDVSQGSYYRDYVDNVEAYVTSMMKELNWQVIEERIKKCEKLARAYQ